VQDPLINIQSRRKASIIDNNEMIQNFRASREEKTDNEFFEHLIDLKNKNDLLHFNFKDIGKSRYSNIIIIITISFRGEYKKPEI
jgi:hypothetical protein